MAQHVSNYSSGSIVITRNIETQDQQPQSLATLANGLKKAAGKLQGLDFSNASISTLSPSIRQFDQITVLNLSQNSLKVFPSVIWLHLKLLRSLDISSNQLREIPQEIFHLRSLETFNISNNNIVQLPNEIGCLFNMKEFLYANNNISYPDASILSDPRKVIPFLRDQLSDIPKLPPRNWVSLPKPSGSTFKVMTYNVLAERMATPSQHPYTPSRVLGWSYRKDLLLQEILHANADIVCLQEVEYDKFTNLFSVEMEKNGYAAHWAPKSRFHYLEPSAQQEVDGCAIFVRRSKFEVVKQRTIEMNRICMERVEEATGYSRALSKDQIAFVLEVRAKGTGRPMVVASTHLHWDPRECDVKLVQAILIAEQLSALRDSLGPSCPLILAGDFNSTPQSGVYAFLKSGSVGAGHADWQGFPYGRYSSSSPSHSLDLDSAYSLIGEPPLTNACGNFVGVLDYIWFSRRSLQLVGYLEPYSVSQIFLQKTPLPNPLFPSDHLPLSAEFAFL